MTAQQLRLDEYRPAPAPPPAHWRAAPTRAGEVRRAVAAEAMRPGALEDRFREYDAAHPEVYRELVRRARAIKATGRAHYSIDTIYGAMRYDADLRRESDSFTLNNSYRSLYSRKIMASVTDLADFFETRVLAKDRTPRV